jgi:hypothetical protein
MNTEAARNFIINHARPLEIHAEKDKEKGTVRKLTCILLAVFCCRLFPWRRRIILCAKYR